MQDHDTGHQPIAKLKVNKNPTGLRDQKKDHHRQQLLDATIEVIYRYGSAGATVSRIAEVAQLSRGMINLHFSSKEQLFLEVSQWIASEYEEHWREALTATKDDPAEHLRALLRADFDERVLNPRVIAVYFDFRAIARANSKYMAALDSRDIRIRRALLSICTRLCEEGPYPEVNPKQATYAFIAIQEGMWVDFHLHPDHFDRGAALETSLHLARAFFPQHFKEDRVR